jgi:protocatechuate 3,4-dioxygenase beta subunit
MLRGLIIPVVALAAFASIDAHEPQTRSPFAGQTRPRQGAVIIGAVMDATTGRGVDRAIVRLRGGTVSQVRVTDSQGRYYFTGIPAGEFDMTATRDGYFEGAYGRLRAGGESLPVQLGSGQWLTDARIDLWRPAVIHGFVVDELGEPVVGVRVYAHRRTYVDGRSQYVASGWELTDDQGAYRLANLIPGDYVVSVGLTQVSVPIERLEHVGQTGSSSASLGVLVTIGFMSPRETSRMASMRGMMVASDPDHHLLMTNSATPPPSDAKGEYAYPRQFYPATSSMPDAQPISVGAGDDRGGVSFQVRPVLTGRLSGRVVDVKGGPVANQLLRLLDEHAQIGTMGSEVALTVSDRDGSFLFPKVPPGRYIVEARDGSFVARTISPEEHHRYVPSAVWQPSEIPPEDPKMKTAWSRAEIEVAGQLVTELELVMQPGIPVTGEIVLDGVGPKVDPRLLAQVPVLIDPLDDPTAVVPSARINSRGGFGFPGVMPGRYAIRLGAPIPGWTIKSITADGQDVADAGFTASESAASVRAQITLSARGAKLTGFVRDSKAQYVRGATVVVLTPARGGAFRLRSTRVPMLAPFVIDALPAGEHFVIAIDEAAAEGWQSPDRLRELRARAMRIVLRESEVRLLDLTLR